MHKPTLRTRYIAPTKKRRAKVSCVSCSNEKIRVLIPYNYERTELENHVEAVRVYTKRHRAGLPLMYMWGGGKDKDKYWVYVTPFQLQELQILQEQLERGHG